MDNKLSDNILTGLNGVIEVNGKLNQTHVLSGAQKQEQYQLSYEALEITGDKNYFLSYLTYEDGTVHTYFFPIQFVGPQKIVFDVPFPVANIQFFIYGNIRLKDTKLQSVLDNTLTEEQKQLLNTVSTNSEYWDRIIAVTSALGNILTNKLEGSINTALNSIAGSEGRMYWEDGKFICRDGKTDAESTMAMLLSPAGFMIANDKLADGNWNWRTFGTGAGFTADEIIAGTLRAIAIEGVTITASTLTGGEIIGAKIKGGSLNINEKFIVDSMGDVQMSGSVTWGADNSPVKVKYSSDNKNWHYNFESNDTFAKYSYDGGLTWTEGIKIRGTDGINGVPGQNGADGQTYYTWIVYADDAFGNGLSLSSNNKRYIGIAYNKPSSTPELKASHYSFSKIQGENGLDGSDGLPGTNGLDGKTYYTWIRYADDVNGNGLSNASEGKAYIGIAYNKETATESNNPKDYTWTKIKGDDGKPGSDANVPSYIQSTKITGTRVESCELAGNIITGSEIRGSTMIGGDEQGVYTKIDPTNPLAVYRPTGKIAELWGAIDGSSYLHLYTREGVDKFSISSGARSGSDTFIRDTGTIDIKSNKAVTITSADAFSLYCWNRTSNSYILTGRSYMEIGNRSIENYIMGTDVHINCDRFYVNGKTQVASLASQSISGLEVAYMELEAKYLKESQARSELEVKLMEKGVL
jgi:hypothetical protein|nr:MAG TPA: tail protein [Caudoviricetes sp.]